MVRIVIDYTFDLAVNPFVMLRTEMLLNFVLYWQKQQQGEVQAERRDCKIFRGNFFHLEREAAATDDELGGVGVVKFEQLEQLFNCFFPSGFEVLDNV